MYLRGENLSLNHPRPSTSFTITRKQESLTAFETSTWFTLWHSGCTHYVNSYFELYTEYKPLDMGGYTEVNGIGGIIKPQGIGTVVLDLEDDTGKFYNLNFENFYYFPGAPKLLIVPHRWDQDRGEAEVGS